MLQNILLPTLQSIKALADEQYQHELNTRTTIRKSTTSTTPSSHHHYKSPLLPPSTSSASSSSAASLFDPSNLISAITTMILDPTAFRESLQLRRDELQHQVEHINRLLQQTSGLLESIEVVIGKPTIEKYKTTLNDTRRMIPVISSAESSTANDHQHHHPYQYQRRPSASYDHRIPRPPTPPHIATISTSTTDFSSSSNFSSPSSVHGLSDRQHSPTSESFTRISPVPARK
ncbi:uncharacterized protein BX664DRAFT_324789 [Halteromyces radiatus]|uniref:uncharacterized protein n=1 Tax=Halteromyces radiatus TaxID=101107 RepID=UPI002220BBA2|nr:uncharacterized protein BX664DRAFT_324789 [Halteromyces radiatus]KAI8096775.1 hypothetical protein BX664DRAFT_324789 [Halteromyces radiatus]